MCASYRRGECRIAVKEGYVSYARQVVNSYPGTFQVDAGVLATTIEVLKD